MVKKEDAMKNPTINYCHHCNVRIVHSRFNSDMIHSCNSGNATRDNEDVKRIGTWTDYSGSNTPSDPQGGEIFRQGLAKKNWGMRSSIEGEDVTVKTRRGRNTELYRTRPHQQFLDFK